MTMSAKVSVEMSCEDFYGGKVQLVTDLRAVSLMEDGLLVLRYRLEDELRQSDRWGSSTLERETEEDYKLVCKLVDQLAEFLHNAENPEPYRCEICGKLGGH